MAITLPERIIPTETVNISDKVGNMLVGTANVPAQGKYLTLVLRDGVPFDMALSDSIAEAQEAHDYFLIAATLMAAVESQKADRSTLN